MDWPGGMGAAGLGLLAVASMVGWATVADPAVWAAKNVDFRSVPALARVTNLSDSSCRDSFSEQLTASLVKQGEPPAEANVISTETTAGLSQDPESLNPRPFHVSSAAGHRYGFSVQSTKSGQGLRRYEL